MFIRVTFYCSNIKEAHEKHSQRDKWPAPFIMLLLLLLLLLWFQFDAAAAAPTAVFGWANEALTQDAFIAMVIFKIVMSLQRARLWYGKAIKFRWWFFFAFICSLDVAVAGSGFGSCHLLCVSVSLFGMRVYLASFCAACHGTWFILGQYQVGHILIYFYGILFVQKFDEFFVLSFFWNQSNVRAMVWWFILDLAWIPHCGFYSNSENSSRCWNSSHC